MEFLHPICDLSLVEKVLSHKHHIEFSVHGIQHWRKVERNGLFLSSHEGGDNVVISLFALFHDSQRVNDFEDPEHGARGATLAEDFHKKGLLKITPEQLDLLLTACIYHTSNTFHDNRTVQCCWDADRLDLVRISVLPDPNLLNTDTAKSIAESMDYSYINEFVYTS